MSGRRRVDLDPHPLDPGVVEGVERDVLRAPQPGSVRGPALAPRIAKCRVGVVGEVHTSLADAEPRARVAVPRIAVRLRRAVVPRAVDVEGHGALVQTDRVTVDVLPHVRRSAPDDAVTYVVRRAVQPELAERVVAEDPRLVLPLPRRTGERAERAEPVVHRAVPVQAVDPRPGRSREAERGGVALLAPVLGVVLRAGQDLQP